MTLERAYLHALRVLAERTKASRVRWIIIGSASLAVQGVHIRPRDIDILTDMRGAFEFNTLLKDYENTPVRFSRSEIFESYFGIFKIEGVIVEVMGDLKMRYGNLWASLAELRVPKFVEIDGLRLPVAELHHQLASYEALNRKTDNKKVAELRKLVLGKSY